MKTFLEHLSQQEFFKMMPQYRPFIDKFMDGKGENEQLLLVLADKLEETGHENLGMALRGAVEKDYKGDADQHSADIDQHHQRVRGKLWRNTINTRSHTHRDWDQATETYPSREWYYASSQVNLNADASSYARSRAERNRFWDVRMPAGSWIYRLDPKTLQVQGLERPTRSKTPKIRYHFGSMGGRPSSSHYIPQDFKDIPFSQVPDDVAAYFFLIAINRVWWKHHPN